MPKSRFTNVCGFDTVVNTSVTRLPTFFRYYDNKRSAKRKEFKTIEAADKVGMIL